MKTADRRARRQGEAHAPAGLTVYHELGPDLYSATSKHVHRPRLRAVRAEEHRRRRRHGRHRLPAALRRVRRLAEPRHRRARRHRLLRPDARDGRRPAGLEHVAAVRTGTIVRIDDSIASRWGPRIVNFVRAVGTALEPARRVAWWRRPPRRARASAPRGVTPRAGRRRRSLPRRLAGRRRARRAGPHRPRRRRSSRSAPGSRSRRPLAALRRPTRRSSGTSACRGSCSPRWSARCSRSPAPRTRACSATRSPTRTCSASPPAPGSARRSRSSTCRAGSTASSCCRPRRSSAARSRSSLAYAIGRSAGASAGRRRSCSPASRSRPSSPRCRPSCSSSTRTRSRRSTRGSSARLPSSGWRDVVAAPARTSRSRRR